MTRQSPISRWCGWIIEAGWLLALTLIPIYFNLYSARHFEPDKATTLRSIVLLMAAAGLVQIFESVASRERTPEGSRTNDDNWFTRLRRIPLALPALIYGLVFLITTFTSVVPATSFWGSYQRLQGTYTYLSYMLLGVLIVTNLRSREQLERLITITLAAATVVGGYGLLQHLGLDPLPWRGDVITRVASTMGNSIFVAAYMIMVVPLALYRALAAFGERRQAAAAANPAAEWIWAAVRALFLIAGLLLVLAFIMFGAAVRTIDFRYFWLIPGAVVCATALWWLLTLPIDRGARAPLWPGMLSLGFLLLFGMQFAFSSEVQSVAGAATAPNAAYWWLVMALSVLATLAGYWLARTLAPLPAELTRTAAMIRGLTGIGITVLLLTAVFFTQSRGPWIGLGAGLFVFFSLVLFRGLQTARLLGNTQLAGRFRALLIAWLALTLTIGGFLIAFNLSNAAIFERLRDAPYIGRMGRLLEVESGTGLVRRLIWAGDEHAGGAIALITSDPLRAMIGYGPESMFVAFNPFYPPALANVEARGASPDRSHQAILDELVTKGVLGLGAYLFVLGSFVALCWRSINRRSEWRWQLFFIATLSAVTAHFVEGLTGIPIVSSLMMLWVLLAVTVSGGALAGHYSLEAAPVEPAPVEPEPAEAAPAPKAPAGRGKQTARGQAARTAARNQPARGVARRSSRNQSNPGAVGAYALIGALALLLVWWFNWQPIYADMRFQQGQGVSERPAVSADGLLQALDDYLATIRSNPREDFYYLNLGRVLMNLADTLRQQGVELGSAAPAPDVGTLLRLEGPQQLVGFVQRTPPMELMSYAEAVLLQAHDLNPLNKDHFANLGRLNSYWFSWTNDPQRLQESLAWYEQVNAIAPQDVTLLNERAGVITQLAAYTEATGDQAQANAYYQQARELLDRSVALDPRFADTYVRIGNLQRAVDEDLAAATASYIRAVELSPFTTANTVETIANSLQGREDLLQQLRVAYVTAAANAEQTLIDAEGRPERADDLPVLRERTALMHSVVGLLSVRLGDVSGSLEDYRRAVILLPDNVAYSRNYTIVLSDTGQYDAAITEVNRISDVLRASGRTNEISQVEGLIAVIEQARQ
ncbi:MAG: hypothetical protein HC822_08990 [Oscillochloris sp.]|nr:hypothetical protein [Oscillochloris sp.]